MRVLAIIGIIYLCCASISASIGIYRAIKSDRNDRFQQQRQSSVRNNGKVGISEHDKLNELLQKDALRNIITDSFDFTEPVLKGEYNIYDFELGVFPAKSVILVFLTFKGSGYEKSYKWVKLNSIFSPRDENLIDGSVSLKAIVELHNNAELNYLIAKSIFDEIRNMYRHVHITLHDDGRYIVAEFRREL